ncbi:BON domain-containing protein [Azohydromonas lata]|uniref:BON domain-containing protein n=1 Tax=Azohydromonas lata TaxID=45677 RepID=A0ABU5IFV4_9BURK|nr:BON domain-containing protein [Azohydromonas lata]MDZ5457545.1 BON domain-containing protein [Azohydromonas lata]
MNLRLQMLAPAAVLGITLALGSGAQAATADDSRLQQQVEQALQAAQLRHADVHAVVVDGKVRLQGWVDAPNDVLQAMRLTAAVPGVDGVTSDLRTWRSSERYY